MIESYSVANDKQAPSPLLQDPATALLRVGTALWAGYYYIWPGLIDTYNLLWKELPWTFVSTLNDAGFSQAHLLAPGVALFAGLFFLSWLVGFLTRIFSALALVLVVALRNIVWHGESSVQELTLLFCWVTLFFLLRGSGGFSLDALFRHVALSRKKSGR